MNKVTLKQKLGCWMNERWKTEVILCTPWLANLFGWNWLDLHNRNERITKDEKSGGRICHWSDSSKLTVSNLFPKVGERILKKANQEWPFRLASAEEAKSKTLSKKPNVSFIIVVRGLGRLPQFNACLASLLAQEECDFEVVVVEQSEIKEFESIIPEWVKYVHTPTTAPFNRSWGLNVGAQNAAGKHLVICDADMVFPIHAAKSIEKRLSLGLDALRLSRYIFFVDKSSSEMLQNKNSFDSHIQLEAITQNTPNPLAVTREKYLEIGGHDESFYRWGGEDNEFMSRLRTLKLSEGSFLPILHLWHEAAENKSGDRNQDHLNARLALSEEQRIEELASLPFGQMTPSFAWNK